MGAPLKARPQIALTFDDAPDNVHPLLSVLGEKEAVATFFLIGENVEEKPADAMAIVSAGMLVGNHSYDHPHFAGEPAAVIRANLLHAQQVIYQHTGVTPRWFRAPFFDWNDEYHVVLPELGLSHAWLDITDINPKDWDGATPQQIIDRVLGQKKPGSIVVLHDGYDNTVQALPVLIDRLHTSGYELVTLDDWSKSAIKGVVTTHGGTAVSGALVTVYNSAGGVVATATTESSGKYRVGKLEPGQYKLGFSAPGFQSQYYLQANTLADATPITALKDHTIAGADANLVDIAPPATALSPALPGTWVNHNVAFELSASDAECPEGIVTFYRLGPDGDEQVYSGPVTVDREGVTDIAFWSRDATGNKEAENHAQVMIDKTPPQTSSDVQSPYVSSATVSLVSTDTGSGVSSTYHSLDNGSWQEGDSVICTESGPHTLRYYSVDVAGNVEEERVVGFSVVVPTSLSGTVSADSIVRGDSVSVTAVLRQMGSGPVIQGEKISIQASSDGENWTTVAEPMSTVTGEASYLGTPQTTTYYRAFYAGSDTYQASTSSAMMVEVTDPPDVTAPETTLHFDPAPNAAGWNRTEVMVSLDAIDDPDGSGVARIEYRLGSDGPQLYTDTFAITTDGVHTIDYWSTDHAGNGEPIQTETIRIDTAAPVTTSDAKSTYTDAAVVTFSATDALSGVGRTEWRFGTSGPWTPGTLLTVGTPGTYTLQFRSVDVAGNVEEGRMVGFSVVMRTSLSGTVSADSIVRGDSVSVSAILRQMVIPGLAIQGEKIAIQASSDGENWTTVAEPMSTVTGEASYLGTPQTTTYYRAVYAGSDTYQASMSDAVTVEVTDPPDTIPPTTKLNFDPTPNAGWNRTEVMVSLDATDGPDGSGVAYTGYRLGSGDPMSYTGAFPITIEGTHSVGYWSIDVAGNTEATKTETIRIDITVPVTTSDAKSSYTSSAAITLWATDALSDVAKTEWRLGTSGSWREGKLVTVTALGAHVLEFRSTDVAGNIEEPKQVAFEILAPVSPTPAPPDTPAPPVTLKPTTLVLTSKSATKLGYNKTFTVAGALRTGGTAVAGKQVILQSAAPGKAFKDTSVKATTDRSGVFAFSVKPVSKTRYRVRFAGSPGYRACGPTKTVTATPKVSVGTPVAPKTMKRSKSYTVYGSLKPKHTKSTKPVRIYKWKRIRVKGIRTWKSYGYVKATAYNYKGHTRYKVRMRLPSTGTWRLRAYAPADSKHAAAWSAKYDTVKVK